MMKRRTALQILGSGVMLATAPPFLSACNKPKAIVKPGLKKPASMYINWAAYDELSDDVFLNESIAMKQLDELIRLKKLGVQVDYYLMDAFWFDADGGYRQWRKGDWPKGPEAWLKKCRQHDIKPGLWISTNFMVAGDNYKFLNVIPEWKDSESVSGRSFSLFEGEYLPHLLESLRMHAKNGIKAFKFDFADFGAVTSASYEKLSATQVQLKNETALIEGLKAFRKDYPDVILMAYNGYGGQYNNTYATFEKTVEEKWLEVFDTLYCGDPRLSDVPTQNFWRSKDIYSDHMVKNYLMNGIPQERIDNSAFMIGTTGTCYYRGKKAWKGMLILSAARGGYLNTYYGNLDLLTDEEGKWFAKVQRLFYPLQEHGYFATLGALPGAGKVYGYSYKTEAGEVIVLVNPSQDFVSYPLSKAASYPASYQLLFRDAGYSPRITDETIDLGPEQLVVVASGEYAKATYELGIGDYVQIPSMLTPIDAEIEQAPENGLVATFIPEQDAHYRLIFQVFSTDGSPKRISGGSPPKGTKLDELLLMEATQAGKPLTLSLEYDKAIWSGLSWASAEIQSGQFEPSVPINVSFHAVLNEKLSIDVQVSKVVY